MLKAIPADRARFVSQVFGRIARRYDLGNRVLSLGRDQSWRRSAVRALDPKPDDIVLDLGAGTADLSLELAKKARTVIAADFSRPMLEVGLQKVRRAGRAGAVPFLAADALDLPFATGSFDGATAAFCVRNLQDIKRGLSEVLRVLKPGARLVCLEFMRPASPFLSMMYRPLLTRILPLVGAKLTGDRSAYVYLAASIKDFSTPQELRSLMMDAGFDRVSYRLLNLGTVAIHVALKHPLPEAIARE